ncbi:fibrobacter succinogenes major paralogous domain-containing protein [Candidatus Saccharibacteria bacterium]|nr:fibrobacter succinogenes major paralogous domain-containing protein [Candidatus Saccharibacteria bacterium]
MKNLHTKAQAGMGKKIDTLSKIGIFSASALFVASAVYVYSPVLGTNADSTVNTKVSAVINPVASLTLDTNAVDFNVTPTSSGVFESKPIVANVSTNSTGGYELYFSSEDESADMINADSAVTDVIASDFSGSVTSSTMAANKWGYSLDNTDFSKIPVLSAQAKIRDLDHLPSSAEKETTVHIGTKIDDSLSAGTYSKTVKFSVVAHATPTPPPTMQTFDKSTLANVGDSATLEDERDGTMYTVKKLADGNVWMTQNLRIVNKTIDSSDSNLPEGTSYTIPASDTSGFTSSSTTAAYLDNTYGGYYSFYTATAGWGVYGSTNSPKDICPKGWRLPTGGSSGELKALYSIYNYSVALMQGEPGFVLSGSIDNGSMHDQGSSGKYWSATADEDLVRNAYYLLLEGSGDSYNYAANKYDGFAVRCMAI